MTSLNIEELHSCQFHFVFHIWRHTDIFIHSNALIINYRFHENVLTKTGVLYTISLCIQFNYSFLCIYVEPYWQCPMCCQRQTPNSTAYGHYCCESQWDNSLLCKMYGYYLKLGELDIKSLQRSLVLVGFHISYWYHFTLLLSSPSPCTRTIY